MRAWGPQQAGLFGGVVAFAALILAVLLGLIGMLTALESRPLVQEMRKSTVDHYRQLVRLGFGGVRVFVGLGAVATLGFLITPSDPALVRRPVAIAAFALMTIGLLQTLRFASYLVAIMTDDTPQKPPKREVVDAVRKQAEGDHPRSSPPAECTSTSSLQPT